MSSFSDNPSGEISSLADSPLEAGNIDDYAGVSASDPEYMDAGGESLDEQAVARIAHRLEHKPSCRDLAQETVLERAETLYALLCRQVVEGAAGEQLRKIADLVGEEPNHLRQRLS